ncbi:MAG: pyridoxal phosphate-dependent aminotransferase [Rickettsiales bacterium]|nr:pyridoxal phosphate-dependent aminotransferase [Rickettsiales bacterium]
MKPEQNIQSIENRFSTKGEGLLYQRSFDLLRRFNGDGAAINWTVAHPNSDPSSCALRVSRFQEVPILFSLANHDVRKKLQDHFLDKKHDDIDDKLQAILNCYLHEETGLSGVSEIDSRKLLSDYFKNKSKEDENIKKILFDEQVINESLRLEVMDLSGHPVLREELVHYFKGLGVENVGISNVLVDLGIMTILEKIYKTLKLKERGKSVLLPIPSFGMYHTQLSNLEIDIVRLETTTRNGRKWSIDPQRLRDVLDANSNIEAIVLNYPNNPTGKVITREEMEEIYGVLKDFPHVKIISDEIFVGMALREDVENLSFGSFKGFTDADGNIQRPPNKKYILGGMSKIRGLGGLRISFLYSDDLEVLAEFPLAEIPTWNCLVAAAALEDNEENRQYINDVRTEYRKNIDKIKEQIGIVNRAASKLDEVKNHDFVKIYDEPEASTVMMLDFSGLRGFKDGERILDTGHDVAEFLFEKARVAMVPGECFFIDEKEMVLRINLSNRHKDLERGFDAIGSAICRCIEEKKSKHSDVQSLSPSPSPTPHSPELHIDQNNLSLPSGSSRGGSV